MKRQAFIDLFRTIAEKHKGILHTTSSNHFGRVILGAPPFQNMEITEFINALKSTLKFPYLLISTYDVNYQDNLSDNRLKELVATFFVLKKCSKENYTERDIVLDDCEEIADDILSYLRNYFKNNPDNTHFNVNTATLEAVGPLSDGIFGVRVDFTLTKAANALLAYDADKWNI